jgi:hypothetical protein
VGVADCEFFINAGIWRGQSGEGGVILIAIYLEFVMIEQNDSIPPLGSGKGIEGELIDRLHEANEKLTHARQRVEAAEKGEYDGLVKRERASHEVHEAEQEIEKVDDQIRRSLKKNETGE